MLITDEAEARAYCASLTNPATIEKFDQLCGMLAVEIQRQNLISSSSVGEIWRRHVADSLQLAEYVSLTAPLLDLGTGAGFPGLVLAIARPDVRIVLVEGRRRRVEWLHQAVDALELTQCEVVGARLESVATFAAGTITARAFAPLDKMLRLAARFSTPATAWLLPKGRSAAQELEQQSLGIRSMFHVKQSRTDLQAGILVGMGVPQST